MKPNFDGLVPLVSWASRECLMWPRNELLRRIGMVWLLLLPVWIAFCAIGTWLSHSMSAFAGLPITWSRAAVLNMVAYSDWAFVLTPVVLCLAWSFPFQLKTLPTAIPIHIASMPCVAALSSLIQVPLRRIVYPEYRTVPFRQSFERIFFASAEPNMWMYWVVVVTAFVIAYYLKFREKEFKTLQLETHLARAQLANLKMQLQPHFLFNALHSISALMHQDVKAADKMISCLGDLLRMSMAQADAHEGPLKQELEFLEKYLEIQKIRFQDQLSVAMSIDPGALSAVVPYLLLQPLVENAIKHGISKRTEAGSVEIDVRRGNDQLLLTVTNDGPSFDPSECNGTKGLGLNNVQARLYTLYGAAHHLDIRQLPSNRTEVRITIPLRTEQQASLSPPPESS